MFMCCVSNYVYFLCVLNCFFVIVKIEYNDGLYSFVYGLF